MGICTAKCPYCKERTFCDMDFSNYNGMTIGDVIAVPQSLGSDSRIMPNIDRTSDESLMEQVTQGDRDAFSCLMTRHKDRVYSMAFRMLGTHEEAEDATQEIFLRIWGYAGKYTPTAKFSTWLYTITTNMCRTRLRSVWRRFVQLKENADDHPAKDSARPDVLLIKKEQQARIARAIQALPTNQRIALMLWRYENLSYQEISEVMECSVAKVETLLFKAKRALRTWLTT